MRRVYRIGWAMGFLLAAACTGGEDAPATTTAPARSTTTAAAVTTTVPPDPFSVPDDPADIDEAYVEAVLNELNRIEGDAVRLASSDGPSPEMTRLLLSVYDSALGSVRLNLLAGEIAAGLPGLARPPGDAQSEVVEVISGSAQCIAVEVVEDFTALGEQGLAGVQNIIRLVPSSGENPTPWSIAARAPADGENVSELGCP